MHSPTSADVAVAFTLNPIRPVDFVTAALLAERAVALPLPTPPVLL